MKKQKLSSDTLFYLSISNIAVDAGQMLNQYVTCGMPSELKKLYESIQKKLSDLEITAWKLSNIELEE